MSAFSKILTATIGSAVLALGVAGSASAQPWDRGYDRGYGYGDYRGGGGERFAVNQCRRAVTDAAMRGATNAKVTDIGNVWATRDGFNVRGEVAIYKRAWNGRAAYDRVGFSCRTDGGRIADVNIGGRRW